MDKTAADAEAKKTSSTRSSRSGIISGAASENDSDAGSMSVKCTDVDAEDGIVAVDTGADVIDVDGNCARPHSSTTYVSSLPDKSRKLDRVPDGSDSDLSETGDSSAPKVQRRSSPRTADSQSQVTPKRMKFQLEDNASDDASDENDDASRAKMSL